MPTIRRALKRAVEPLSSETGARTPGTGRGQHRSGDREQDGRGSPCPVMCLISFAFFMLLRFDHAVGEGTIQRLWLMWGKADAADCRDWRRLVRSSKR